MSCLINTGRTEPCKDTLGGLKAAYFANYDVAVGAFTVAANVVTAIGVGLTEVFKFDLTANTNTLDQAIIGSKDAGTRVNTQTLTLAFKKQGAASHATINTLIAGRPVVIVQDRNDNYHVLGITEGMETTGSSITTGAAQADFNGYNLTMVGVENSVAPLLDDATINTLQTLVSATNINPDA